MSTSLETKSVPSTSTGRTRVKKKVAPCLKPRGTPYQTKHKDTSTASEPKDSTTDGTDTGTTISTISTPTNATSSTATSTVTPTLVNRKRRSRTLSTSSQNDDTSKEEETVTKKRKQGTPDRPQQKQFYEAPDPSTMTMQDLIYYNPSANPMSSSKEKAPQTTPTVPLSSHVEEQTQQDRSLEDEEEEGRIVPQLKIAADGTIQIDESSMVVETTKPLQILSETVIEDDEHTTSTSFRQRYKIKKWTKEETNQFYKALIQVGTDFTMMTLVLPKRTRKELKNKFKKEEKSNPLRISAALERLMCSKPVT